MAGNGNNIWNNSILNNPLLNSPYEFLERDGIRIDIPAHITGDTDDYKISVFKLTGTVTVLNQSAELTIINALTNMTAVYSDLWADTGGAGTEIGKLTAEGATLSGLPVGSWFTKDKDTLEQYSVISAALGGIHEVREGEDVGRPFTITQRAGVDTFIRFCYSTNTTLDYWMNIFFKYLPINGGSLELAA